MEGKPEKPGETGFYLGLVVRSIFDGAVHCGLPISLVQRDVIHVTRRVESEGLEFLTKTLPSLGKRLDKTLGSGISLSEGWDLPFSLSSKEPHCPRFLGAFWKLIFRPRAQAVLQESIPQNCFCSTDQPDRLAIAAVRAVRQICYLLYKLEGAHSLESEKEVLDSFVAVDSFLPSEGDEIPLSHTSILALENAKILVQKALGDLDLSDITPGHGPGAVATGEAPWEKMIFRRYFRELDEMYPYSDYFFYSYTHLCDELGSLEQLEESESVAKVALVPKDSRGPRLISMEPLENQWIQQGQFAKLVERIESTGAITCGLVNFTDQEINRELARDASMFPETYDTLDMKEASDRVSMWLVAQLFPPHVLKYLRASRSKKTQLPDGRCITLRKFAPMGSACCFPVEALTFWALAVGTLLAHTPGWTRSWILPRVYVYGDDMIVPHGTYQTLAPVFNELFLKFNEDKCCRGGLFRESCGMDAFYGEDVSPARLETRWNTKLSPAAALSYAAFYNNCRDRGLEETGMLILEFLQSQRFGSVTPTNKIVGRLPYTYYVDVSTEELHDMLRSTFKVRYNTHLQREEVLIMVPLPRIRKYGEPGWLEMLRLCRKGRTVSPYSLAKAQPTEPCRYAVPHRIKMRRRWVALDMLSA